MFLGVDLGTGSLKAVLLDSSGLEIGEPSGYALLAPQAGAAEANPEAWWAAMRSTVLPLVKGRAVEAISFCGQMHGIVLVDRTKRLLRPPILWPDTRSARYLDAYEQLSPSRRAKLANPLATGMAGPSLLWVRDNEPDVYRETAHVLQPKDYLRMALTGEVSSEPSDASGTLLYDIVEDSWYWELVESLGLEASLLPAILPSASVVGTLSRKGGACLGLAAGLPVAAGAADTAAAVLGFGLQPGEALLTIGTGGQIVAIRDRPVPDPAGATHLYRSGLPGQWYAMAAVENVGLALSWVLRLFDLGWAQAYAEAFAAPPGSGGVLFAPYLSGERTPMLDPFVRGGLIGMGLEHGRGHLLRAAFEGVAFGLRRGLESLEAAGVNVSSLFVSGGGAVDARWLQLLADVFGRPVDAVNVTAVAARGAAILAATSYGVDLKGLTGSWRRNHATRFTPGPVAEMYGDLYLASLGLYPALRGFADRQS